MIGAYSQGLFYPHTILLSIPLLGLSVVLIAAIVLYFVERHNWIAHHPVSPRPHKAA
jgi:hypothetical protein